MAEVIKMPKMSDTMEEGVIASWLVKEGDEVKSGDILAEVETDKATMELESYEDGVLLHIGVKETEAVPVDGVIAIIGEKGEDISDLLKTSSAPVEAAQEANDKVNEPAPADSGGDEVVDASDVKAEVITMPKMSDTMEEGTIASWLKKVGDKVEAGDILAEVETDKATMELEAYEDGTLLYIGVESGDSVVVDGVIAIIGEEGADYKKLLKATESKSSGSTSEPVSEPKKEETPKTTSVSSSTPSPVTKPPSSCPSPSSTPS